MSWTPAERRRKELYDQFRNREISRSELLLKLKEERLTRRDFERARADIVSQAKAGLPILQNDYITTGDIVRNIAAYNQEQKQAAIQEYKAAEVANIQEQQKQAAIEANRQRMMVEQPKQQPITRTAIRQQSQEPMITTGQQKRITVLLEREKRLKEFTTLGGTLAPNPNASEWNIKEIGKMVARKPLELAAAPSFIGGRVGLAADLATSQAGRNELARAFFATPQAVVSSYDIRKPEGILNIGLTALSIKGFADARIAARQQVKYGVEGLATRRSGSIKEFRDVTKGRVEALVGNKKIVGKISGTEEFIKQGQKTYVSGGQTTIKYSTGKTAILDTRAITKLNAKGSNTVQIAKVSKGVVNGEKFYLTKTRTAMLETEPLATQRTISTTRALKQSTPLISGKPSTVNTGISQEVFRQNLVTESGQGLQTSLFNTGRVTIGAKTLNQNYGFNMVKQARGNLPSGAGGQTTSLRTTTSQIPTATTAQAALAQIKSTALNIKTAQISSGILQGTAALAVSRGQIKQEQSVLPKTSFMPMQQPISKPIQKTPQQQIPQTRQLPMARTINTFSIIPMQDFRYATIQQQAIRPQQQPISRAIQANPVPINITIPQQAIATTSKLPPFSLKFNAQYSESKALSPPKLTGFKAYKPSLEALFFNVRGQQPKVITPYSLRPIVRMM